MRPVRPGERGAEGPGGKVQIQDQDVYGIELELGLATGESSDAVEEVEQSRRAGQPVEQPPGIKLLN